MHWLSHACLHGKKSLWRFHNLQNKNNQIIFKITTHYQYLLEGEVDYEDDVSEPVVVVGSQQVTAHPRQHAQQQLIIDN